MDRPRSPSIPRPANANGQDRSASPLWDESPSPRYRSPSRGRPRSFHGTPRERSYSRSTSRSSSSSRSRKAHGKSHDDNHHGLFKTSAGLLAGIGVATFLAHKVWPKGILYGDLEDWACKQPEPKRRPPPQRRISDPQRVPRRNPRDGRDGRDGPPPRVIERVRERGNVLYREEIVPVRKGDGRRRDLEARGFERMGRPGDRGRQPPPYPDRAYPDERFYGPSSSRVRPGEPVYR